MPIRLVAADLDGTLILPRRAVSARVRAALAACRDRGVPTVAVTARRWFAAEPVVRDLALRPFALVATGTVMRDSESGAVIDSVELPAEVVAVAVAAIAAAGLQPLVCLDRDDRQLTGPAAHDNAATAVYLSRGAVERRDDLSSLAVAATRVLVMGSLGAVTDAARACAALPAHRVFQESIIQPGGDAGVQYELHVAAADKGSGLLRLCARLEIDPGEVLAIGDSPSDLPMLDSAGTAVVMGNAGPDMWRDDFIRAPSVEDDGAAWALETLVLR